jgi:tetratricopeptide (TPR) repeat protein
LQLKELEFLAERGRLEQARKRVADLLRENPSSVNGLIFSAWIENRLGDNEKALALINQALVAAPNNENALAVLFTVFRDLRRFSEAENAIKTLLKIAPENGQHYAQYAFLMLKTLHLKKARTLIAEARCLCSDDVYVKLISLLIATAGGGATEIDHQLSDIIRNYPDKIQTTVAIFAVLERKGRYREALKIAQELLRADPGNRKFLNAVINLKILSHPLMVPLYPIKRLGRGGVLVYILWAAAIIAGHHFLGEWSLPFLLCFIAYLAYSLIVPVILKKAFRKNL